MRGLELNANLVNAGAVFIAEARRLRVPVVVDR
jgi:hypothetical protein